MVLKGHHSNWWNDSAIDSSMIADAAQKDMRRAIYSGEQTGHHSPIPLNKLQCAQL